MRDISRYLQEEIKEKGCSSLYAFLCLSEEKNVRILQPKSIEETGRGLRNPGNIKDYRK